MSQVSAIFSLVRSDTNAPWALCKVDSSSLDRKAMAESAARPKKPDAVIPAKEIGLVLYADDKTVGLQFPDGAGKRVFLW